MMKHMIAKGAASAILLYVTELQHQYGTILWIVLAMVILDVLLNVGDEQKQFNKLGSAFVAIGAPTIISTQATSPAFAHTLLALIAIAYVQILYPQIITLVKKMGGSVSVQSAEMILIQDLQNQVLKLSESNLPKGTTVPVSTTNSVKEG